MAADLLFALDAISPVQSYGFYCREGDHDRCSMNPCGCLCHLEAMRKRATLEFVEPTRSPFEGTGSNWKPVVRYDERGRRICPNDGCGNVLIRVNHDHGRYPRECIDCKKRAVERYRRFGWRGYS
jgi:hypothetical protein